MSFNTLEILIRTHDARLYLSEQLKSSCIRHIHPKVQILNTGVAHKRYSEKFHRHLHNFYMGSDCRYVLILEDDMTFSEGAKSVIIQAMALGLSHVWFSIPSLEVFQYAHPMCKGFKRLHIKDTLSYSGAILLRSDLLKEYLEHYFFKFLELDDQEFDLNLSRYLSCKLQHLVIREGVFGTDLKVESSLNKYMWDEFRQDCHKGIDPYFSLKNAVHKYNVKDFTRINTDG